MFANQGLRVEATECCVAQISDEPPAAWVTVAATGEVIGALEDAGPVGTFGWQQADTGSR